MAGSPWGRLDVRSDEYKVRQRLAAFDKEAPKDWRARLRLFAERFCDVPADDFDTLMQRVHKRAADAERRRRAA